ncbi:hypothetical protein V5O48_000438 [Marasmius crinis-equi]|uniref:Nudix hydrolase domain-containing protein n=1 Tax=Marasmius crinis-equi TaxID=585013 RepID=A0ABR3G1E5_9AGAR
MANPGLLQWGNSIRFLMANDSGRESFQQQVHTHGFLFLDDYLDNILARPKQDAMIDLLKTPSRRKNTQKPKVKNPSPSKLRTVLSLENDVEKENAAPVNSFHKALLQAKEKEDQPDQSETPLERPAPPHSSNIPSVSIEDVENDREEPVEHEEPMEVIEHNNPIELSVIAEDDEAAERSRISSHPSPAKPTKTEPSASSTATNASSDLRTDVSTVPPTNAPSEAPVSAPLEAVETLPKERVQSSASERSMHTADATMSSVDTFHSIPIEPPAIPSAPLPEEIQAPSVPAVVERDEQSPVDEPMFETDQTDSLPRGDGHTMPLFPPLPAPIPIRKSVRAPRETSAEPGPLGAATPGAAIGKRTSWLMKSREVKALESGNVKAAGASSSNQLPVVPGVPNANPQKRKSGDMLGHGIPGMSRQDDGERVTKVAKKADDNTTSFKPTEKDQTLSRAELAGEGEGDTRVLETQTGGMLDQFKKTVEGLGVRLGKSSGKSLGGALKLNALAEARAAAEAKVAERNRQDGDVAMQLEPGASPAATSSQEAEPTVFKAPGGPTTEPSPVPAQSSQSRLSLSELAPAEAKNPQGAKKKDIGSLFPPEHENRLLSQTNKPNPTAPASPFSKLFSKPTPVFVPPSPPPPVSRIPQQTSPRSAFSKPPSMAVGLSPRLPASPPMPQSKRPPLSTQSTWESIRSDASEKVFSQETPAWVPSSQDTEYDTQPQRVPQSDEDDSWPIDGKLGDKIKQWPFGMALNTDRDSLTWSSAPTESQKVDDEVDVTEDQGRDREQDTQNVPGSFCMDVDEEEEEEADEADIGEGEGDMSIDIGKSTVSLVETKSNKHEKDLPVPSSSQSQSQPSQGFFGHASKLVSSVLGTNKKPKTEVKSIQLAAAVAKKQQEEKDKKAAVLKNMESRRQLVLQKKAEEERARQLEEEKKIREEQERRKREREENTGKIPVKPAAKKDEDLTGKRKIELKKPAPGGLNSSTSSKSTFKPTLKAAGPSHSTNPSTSAPVAGPSNLGKGSAAIASKYKAKTPAKGGDDEYTQPSQMIQSQMTARAKAQLQAANKEPVVASESIELPEINSEYSDSDDEDRKKTFDPPEWAQSPELKQALQMQSTINPDEIFGAIQPLRMEEIFKNGRTSRFRPRTSSANWNGSDRLTKEEENDYKKRMGFRYGTEVLALFSMSSSSSSSPEISPAGRADSPHERYLTQEDVLEDLQSRFILNLPEEELASLERVCFQVEQAHWFYEDFVREENPKFPSLPLKKFSAILFESCPLLRQWSGAHEQAFTNFMQYKTRVPVCGAIMLNETWEKCLLVKGWKSSSGWGFPKGKINEDEPQPACAVREVLEETGYNLAGQVNPEDVIEMSIKEQKIALYIVPGVSEDFPFKTKTRKEISKIEWFRLADLPTWKRNKTPAGKFYLITPFISALKAFIHDRKPRNLPRRPKSKRQAQREPAEPIPNGHDSAVSDSPSTPYQDAHQESSSQSSSADNGEPQTPSPQFSQSFADRVDIAPEAEPPLDPHFARLLSSLTLSGSPSGSPAGVKKEQAVAPALPIPRPDDGPRSTPVPTLPTSGSHIPRPSSRVRSPLTTDSATETRFPSATPHTLQERILGSPSPSPYFQIASGSQVRSPAPTELPPHASPYASASRASARPAASRRSSSVADISPYLSKSVEIPTSAKQLRQLALLESIADESARMSPFMGGRDVTPAPGLNHLSYPPPLPPASVPPQAFGIADPNVIYSSGSNAAPQGMNIPAIPHRPIMHDDPFQVRPRTSQAINRPIYHSPPAASMSMNQSQLLALMNTSGNQSPFPPRQPLPQFQRPPAYPPMPQLSPYNSPLAQPIHVGAYPPTPLHSTAFSALPPPGIITSAQPVPPMPPAMPHLYAGQPAGTNSLLSILNQR